MNFMTILYTLKSPSLNKLCDLISEENFVQILNKIPTEICVIHGFFVVYLLIYLYKIYLRTFTLV